MKSSQDLRRKSITGNNWKRRQLRLKQLSSLPKTKKRRSERKVNLNIIGYLRIYNRILNY
jgi:hypothetical protein